jgi:DNA (cytosine-5)-methyltransferase 1
VIADLYCGAGGWHVALDRLGLPHTGYDSDHHAIATYTAAGGSAVLADLTRTRAGAALGVVASPPCQPYTQAGKREGRADPRSRLALLVPHWCHAADWVAMEQVTGGSSVFSRVAALLTLQGFSVARYTLHAEQYGVPQTRTRMVLMAHRHGRPPKPTPTHSRYYPHRPHHHDPGLPPPRTMADALGWGPPRPYPALAAGTAAGGADPQMVGGSGGRAALAAWVYQRPATTIVGSFQPETVAAPAYRTTTPRQHAPGSVDVTLSEAGVLQGFPPDYPWRGTATSTRQQVGNAIPPPLALAVITTLQEM